MTRPAPAPGTWGPWLPSRAHGRIHLFQGGVQSPFGHVKPRTGVGLDRPRRLQLLISELSLPGLPRRRCLGLDRDGGPLGFKGLGPFDELRLPCLQVLGVADAASFAGPTQLCGQVGALLGDGREFGVNRREAGGAGETGNGVSSIAVTADMASARASPATSTAWRSCRISDS